MYRKSALAVWAIVSLLALVCSRRIPLQGTRQELEKAFKAKYGANTMIVWNNATNCVSRLDGKFATHHVVTDTLAAIRVVMGFLKENRGLLGTGGTDLRLRRVWTMGVGEYGVDFDEYFEGIRVEHAETRVELQRDGTVIGVGSRYVPDINVSVVPAITLIDAVSAAARSFAAEPYVPRGSAPSVGLVIYPIRSESPVACHLAWCVDYGSYTYFIDAVDGSQIERRQNFISD